MKPCEASRGIGVPNLSVLWCLQSLGTLRYSHTRHLFLRNVDFSLYFDTLFVKRCAMSLSDLRLQCFCMLLKCEKNY